MASVMSRTRSKPRALEYDYTPSIETSAVRRQSSSRRPETKPLVESDLYDGLEEAGLEQLEFELMGPRDNEDTYEGVQVPSPPSSRPGEPTDEEVSPLLTHVGMVPCQNVATSPLRMTTTDARDFSALYNQQEPYAPGVYPVLHEPAPPTYREVASNPHAFRSPAESTSENLGTSSASATIASNSSTNAAASTAVCHTHIHTHTVTNTHGNTAVSRRHPSLEETHEIASAIPATQANQSVIRARIEDLKYVQCLACTQWLQVVQHASLVYCPRCSSITSSMVSNTRWPLITRRDISPFATLLSCVQGFFR